MSEPWPLVIWSYCTDIGKSCFSLQVGDSSSTTSSVEVVENQEEESSCTPVSSNSTGPKFVLRLASREHLGKRVH